MPERFVPRGRAEGELVHVRLSEDHSAGGAQATDHLGVHASDATGEQARADGRAHARDVDVVLHDDRKAIEGESLAA